MLGVGSPGLGTEKPQWGAGVVYMYCKLRKIDGVKVYRHEARISPPDPLEKCVKRCFGIE